jgi:hypothetical protein
LTQWYLGMSREAFDYIHTIYYICMGRLNTISYLH